MPFRNAILVVGPPRSGTSAVCHVLNECGVDFGDPADFVDPAVNAHNPVFFELVDLNDLNERMMARMGWTYGDFNALPLQDDFSSSLADEFEAEVTRLIERFSEAPSFGLKDPRFCFTLPLWIALLSRLGIRPRVLRTRRDASAVALSNARLSPERGIEYGQRIAMLSDAAASYFLRDIAHETVQFEDLRGGAAAAISSLAVTASVGPEEVSAACSRIFRDELVHWHAHVSSDDDAPVSASDYEQLGRLMRTFGLRPGAGDTPPPDESEALAQLELVATEHIPFVQGPVQVYYRREQEVFAEERSVVVPWPSRDWEEAVVIEIPDPGGEYFRVDVNISPGAYMIDALSIDGVAVAPLSAFLGANGAAYELTDGAIGLIANHDDPWIYFRSPNGPASVLRVRISRITPEEVGRRLFDDRRLEFAIGALQQRISQSDDRTVECVASLHDVISQNGERVGARLTDLETAGLQPLLGGITSLGQSQESLIASYARDGDTLRALIEDVRGLKEAQAEFSRERASDSRRLDESQHLLVERIGEIERRLVELHQAQHIIAERQAKDVAQLQDSLGSLAELRRISLMGWWEKRKFKKGTQ